MAAGRRTSLASLAGAKVETVPGQNEPILVRLAPDRVVPTPLNPRTNFGTADSLAELGESMRKRQLQPVVVVSRASYLKLFPEHADTVGSASYVIANGERRYRGARQAGLPVLEAIIREEVAETRSDFIDAVLSENIDRQNFDPIEEALAVQTMVKECGTGAAAAERFRRSPGWISQRLALLRLAPEIQGLVRSGQMPVRDARQIAQEPADAQLRVWRERQREREQARQEPAPPAGPAVAAPAVAPPAAAAVAEAPSPAPMESAYGQLQALPTARQPAPAPPADTGAARPHGDAALAEARSLVARFGPADRQRIAAYLLAANKQDQSSAQASGR